ncbi:MAG TPA: serine/threonine-protein kinase [Allosphingosinicella sp.]|nr:serine/threonine-protein kinase [Allosphingosinicella sp.]
MSDLDIERQAIALFERLLDIPDAERDAWLDANLADQPVLQSRVRAMVAGDRNARMRTGAALDEVDEELPPERIGAYRIVRLIGRGGMGSVYLGTRATGDFTHEVAIKIIKPGLLSESLVERFERERQTLASLTHPAIAHLYDGGATDSGSPYFIMEYVDGLPLLDWVEETQPSRAERQRLFGEICAAVAFAHRNLIVHRDLTPSNVLVTPDHRVKLIDFGIARPAEQPAAAGERSSASIDSLSLTPGYAAPERMTSSEVTTAADIYSLGKLLNRLIPPGPKDRELKAIVARATAMDPLDRYPTADALAADVAAWRDGFPISAVAGGRWYRTKKFIGRHRLGVGGATLALLLIVGALALTFTAYRSAEAARQAEAARFQDLRSLARYMVFELNGRLARVPGNTAARVTLADRAQTYLSALAASPDADDALKLEAAQGLITLANVQGVPAQPNFGQPEPARANLRKAIDLLNGLELPPAARTPDLVRAQAALAIIQAHIDTNVEGANRTLAATERLLGAVPAAARTPAWHLARRQLRHAQLELTVLGEKLDEMQRLSGVLEREITEWPAAMRNGREAAFDRAWAIYYRGMRGYYTDELDQAVTYILQSQAMLQALDRALPNDPVTLYALMWNSYVGYGSSSGVPSRAAEMRAFLDLAVRTSERLVSIESNDNALFAMSATLRQSQAQLASSEGRHAEAIAIQRDAVATLAATVGPGRRTNVLNRMITANVTLGNIARRAGQRALACDSYRAARDIVTEVARRNALVAPTRRYIAGLDTNLGLCASGAPTARFTNLE